MIMARTLPFVTVPVNPYTRCDRVSQPARVWFDSQMVGDEMIDANENPNVLAGDQGSRSFGSVGLLEHPPADMTDNGK